MTNRQIGELGIALLALYFLVRGGLGFSSALVTWATVPRDAMPAWALFVMAGAAPLFAAALWFSRRKIAARIFPAERPVRMGASLATFAVRLVAMVLLVRLVNDLLTVVRWLVGMGGWNVSAPLVWGTAAGVAIGAAVVIFLLRGARAITDYFPREGVASIAFAAGGLYMAFSAIPSLVATWVILRPPADFAREQFRLQMLEHSLILVAGILLFLGASGLARMWRGLHPMSGAQSSGHADL